jgi:superfamily II DNA or RNA helicase
VITDEDISRVVSRNAFDAGLEYHLDGRVQQLHIAPDGSSIKSAVKGGGRSPYRQTIRIIQTGGRKLQIFGSCTCPVGANCKHVAAALFSFQAEPKGTDFPAAPGHTKHPSPQGGAQFRQSAGIRKLQKIAPPEEPLPPEVYAWLQGLEAAYETDTEEYPENVRKRLLYIVDRGPHSGGALLNVYAIGVTRDGSMSGPHRRYDPRQINQPGLQPKYLRPSDRRILTNLLRTGVEGEEDFIGILRNIIATQRGRWRTCDGPPLTEGDPVEGKLVWTLSDDGRQRPELALPENLLLLRLAEPWYVDPATGLIGPVATELPARVVRAMLAGPALHAKAAARVRAEMARRLPNHTLPAPEPVAPPQLLQVPLQPKLCLFTSDVTFSVTDYTASGRYTTRGSQPLTERMKMAGLSWRYGPVSLPAGTQRNTVLHNHILLEVVRDSRAEARASTRTEMLGFGKLRHHRSLLGAHEHADDLILVNPSPDAWLNFMLRDIPQLRAEGWLIEIAGDFPLRTASPSGDISFEIREQAGIDWFDVDLGVMVDGNRINLVPALSEMIARFQSPENYGTANDDEAPPLLLHLPDGRILAIPRERLQPIIGPLMELFAGAEETADGAARLSRPNAGDLALLEAASEGAGIVWRGGEALRCLGRQLRDHGGIPFCSVPSGFGTTLRAYQERGLAWLQFLRSAELGGILADNMGLGKTVQALAHLAVEQTEGRLDRPALVICPTSLVANWRSEANRFAPGLRTLILHGPDRAERFHMIGAHDLVITTYPLLARDHSALVAQDWHIVMLDEAQTIKNPLAATSRLARTLRARQRLCLSGTPLENHLGELWSLFDFLMPGFLGDRQNFGRRFRTPIEKAGNDERRSLLKQRIAPFMLRRTKQEVAPDLPAKTSIAQTVELGANQRAVYEGIRLAMHKKVRAAIAERGLARSGIIILDALLKLRQACCDPRLLKLETIKATKPGSAKLERLLEMLPALLEEGRRILLFSQFTSMLALIQAELERLSVPYLLLTGDTRDRATPIRQFQSGEVPLFLISLKAGGVGLNLTAADTVIHYDPWWNPAVEDQATDRAHRIGQDKPVFVHRLIAAGTIEEKMQVLKDRKMALASGILDGVAAKALALTEGDLEMLFEPIVG